MSGSRTAQVSERDEAEKLVEQAHQVCPYSNAARGDLEGTVTVA